MSPNTDFVVWKIQTMNVASRMESTGMAGRIQLSQDAATLVEHAGKRSWLIARDDAVQVKGKVCYSERPRVTVFSLHDVFAN